MYQTLPHFCEGAGTQTILLDCMYIYHVRSGCYQGIIMWFMLPQTACIFSTADEPLLLCDYNNITTPDQLGHFNKMKYKFTIRTELITVLVFG